MPKFYRRQINNGFPATDYIIIGALTTIMTHRETLKVSSTPSDPEHLCLFPSQTIEQISLKEFVRSTKSKGAFHLLADLLAINTRLRKAFKKIVDFLWFWRKEIEDEHKDLPFNNQVVTHPETGEIIRMKTNCSPSLGISVRTKKEADNEHRPEEGR